MSESETKESVDSTVTEKESKTSDGGGEEFDESGLVEEGELDYDEEEEGELVEGVKVKRKDTGVNSDQLEDSKGGKREMSGNEVKESKADLEEGELDDEDDLEEGELKDSIEEKPKQPKQDRNYRQGVRPRRMHEMRQGRFRPIAPPEFGLPGPPFPQMIPPRPPPIGITPGWPDGPPVRGPVYGSSDRFRERSPKKEESAWERGMKHVKEVLKAASLRKERQAQGREGSASPQSGDAAKENDGVDKRSPDRGDSRYGHPKSPTWRQSDHRRSRLQYSGSHSSHNRDRRRRSLSSGSRSRSRSPSPRNLHRNRRRSRSHSRSRSPNYRSMDRSRQPDEWKDPWRRSPSPSSGRRPMRTIPGRRSPSPVRRRKDSLEKDRERRSGGKRWHSRSRSVSRSRSLSREPDVKKRRGSSPRRRSRSPRRRSSPSPAVSKHRREQSPHDRSRHSRSRSGDRSPSSDAQQSRQRDKRSPGLEVGAGDEVEKQTGLKGKEGVGKEGVGKEGVEKKEEKRKKGQFSSISGSSRSGSSRGSSHEKEVPPTKSKQTYDAVSPVLSSKVHGISPVSSPDDLNKLKEQQKAQKEGPVETLSASQHKGISFKLIGKKRWLKASTENVSPPETPTPTEVSIQPVAVVAVPTAPAASSSGIPNVSKVPNDQEATARKQRLLDELKAVEAAIARKKAKIKPPSQTETAVHDR